MVPERIPVTLTASSSSPMDSCGRDPICRPSEPLFCRPKLPSPTMIAVATSHHNRNFTIRMGQPSGRLARNGLRVLEADFAGVLVVRRGFIDRRSRNDTKAA